MVFRRSMISGICALLVILGCFGCGQTPEAIVPPTATAAEMVELSTPTLVSTLSPTSWPTQEPTTAPNPSPTTWPTLASTDVPTPMPDGVLTARDAVLNLISATHSEDAPAQGLSWDASDATPEGLVGAGKRVYKAGDWTLAISWPVVAPDAIIYRVSVANHETGFEWEGEVDAKGRVTELGSRKAEQEPSGEEVEGLAGMLYGNPSGAQFDDYFQSYSDPDTKVGIDSMDPDIRAHLVALRDKGFEIRVWGTLLSDVPDFGGAQLLVTRLEVGEGESEAMEAIGRFVKLPPGSQHGSMFEREDGKSFTYDATTDELRAQVQGYLLSGELVRLTGTYQPASGHVTVEQLTVVASAEPVAPSNLSSLATASASSALPSDSWGTYHAASAIDGALSTPWSEGVDGSGAGEWIMLTFSQPVEVTAVGVAVGYDRDANDTIRRTDLFDRNNRVKRATLQFSSGESIQWTFSDERGVQTIPLARAPGPNLETTFVRLVIEDIYPGSYYDDTCIAEFEVWGRTR